MSRASEKLLIPEFRVSTDDHFPHMIELTSGKGLGGSVFITPDFDLPNDRYFIFAALANGANVDPGKRVGGKLLELLVSVKGQDVAALAHLGQTLKDIETLANAARNAKAYFDLRQRALGRVRT